MPLSDHPWQDYYSEPVPNDPYGPGNNKVDITKFTDEVKLKGTADATGKVIWATPTEPVKLGGYVLLEVTPKNYADNLNLINPNSEDNELLRVVNLKRDGSIEREVNNVYLGEQAASAIHLSENGISFSGTYITCC